MDIFEYFAKQFNPGLFWAWVGIVVGAFLYGFFMTMMTQKDKRLDRACDYAFPADYLQDHIVKTSIQFGAGKRHLLQEDYSRRIRIPCLTLALFYVCLTAGFFKKWFVACHYRLFYNIQRGLFLDVNPEAERAWANFWVAVVVIITIALIVAFMLFGICLRISCLEKKCSKGGFYVRIVNQRGPIIWLICFIIDARACLNRSKAENKNR